MDMLTGQTICRLFSSAGSPNVAAMPSYVSKGPARRWHVHCPSRAGPFFNDTAYRPSPPKYPLMAFMSPDSGTVDGSAVRSAFMSALVIDDARPVDSRCNS